MSYSIYYDRAFVRVGDRYIPLANSGSNNCFELKGRREVPEKAWGILNWKRAGQALFTEAEIREIAKDYDEYNQESGMIFKSRHRVFEPGEFERWVIGGMKNAFTVEEYHSFGNRLYVLDYSPEATDKWTRHYFSSTNELIALLDRFAEAREISIKMDNNREVHRPIKHRSRGLGLRAGMMTECYILAGEGKSQSLFGCTIYFLNLTRSGFQYTFDKDCCLLKAFRTEHDANRYIGKYAARLEPYAVFRPELITAGADSNGGISACV